MNPPLLWMSPSRLKFEDINEAIALADEIGKQIAAAAAVKVRNLEQSKKYAEAVAVCDRVAVMYAGQIVETGTVAEVFSNALQPYTQGLLECIPIPGKTPPGTHLGSIP